MENVQKADVGRDWYPILVLLRVFAVFFAFGYIHPDGFFQAPEVVAEDIFGLDVDRPWEFTSKHADAPARTIVTPAITCGLPYLLLKFVASVLGPRVITTYTLFYLPRFFLLLCSFLIDYTTYELSGKNRNALLAASSCWVMLTYMLTPFSNTVETLLFCLLLLSVFKKEFRSTSLTGAVIAVGIFNRFTFFFYALPVVIYLFYRVINNKPEIGKLISGLSFGFFVTSFFLAVIDSVYFGSVQITIGDKPFRWLDIIDPGFWASLIGNIGRISFKGSLVVTPLNNLRYNLNPANLAMHGVHPRWLHVAINLPMLFGPLFLAFVLPWSNALDEIVAAKMLPPEKRPRKGISPLRSRTYLPAKKPRGKQIKLDQHIEYVLIACLVSSVGFHSIATHQEMRFLLPNFVCLIILGCQEYVELFDSSPIMQALCTQLEREMVEMELAGPLWFVLLYLWTCSSGMVPAMAGLQSHATTSPGTTHIIFYHTYMPPKHLLAITKTIGPGGIQVYDMMGPDTSTLKDVRTKSLRIAEAASFDKAADEIFLVVPGTVHLHDPTEGLTGWTLYDRHWLHYSFEDSPEWSPAELGKLSLDVYKKDK